MGLSGTIWVYLGLSATILDYLAPCGTIWEYLGVSGTIRDYPGLSGTVWDYLGLSGTIWTILGLFEIIWDNMGLSHIRVQVETLESKLLLFQNFFIDFFFLLTGASPRGARAPKGRLTRPPPPRTGLPLRQRFVLFDCRHKSFLIQCQTKHHYNRMETTQV